MRLGLEKLATNGLNASAFLSRPILRHAISAASSGETTSSSTAMLQRALAYADALRAVDLAVAGAQQNLENLDLVPLHHLEDPLICCLAGLRHGW
jgi:hypothetical protein